MPIHVLPENVASAIAAGEVVERPVSVVKELLENSLDAGSKRIEVIAEQGGRRLIEVADDGSGIASQEVALSVERYATSKLETVDDLYAIKTLGFRGEALSSIAAVSRMELTTRSADEAVGTRLIVEGGAARPPQPSGAPQGTVVRVRDLFFNVPARLRFLKSETTERRLITKVVTRYALAYPEVSFRLVQEGREAFHSPGNGNRREVLAQVLGPDTAKQMVPIPETDRGEIQVEGFISQPSVHRSSRRELTFFVNGRWIQDASLSAAVVQAYQGLLMVGRYPLVVLLIRIPESAVDVNVHPTKAEIRFREPRLMFSYLQRIVRATLLGQGPPVVEFQDRWAQQHWGTLPRRVSPDWQVARRLEQAEDDLAPLGQPGLPEERVPLLRPLGQIGRTYLVAEGPDGLYLIDQHAAHERVLFEALMSAKQEGVIESQALLEPVTVEFSPSQAALLEEQLEALRGLGFQVEEFGRQAYRLRSVPGILTDLSPELALRTVVEEFEEDETPLAAEVEARLAARICKRAATKAGQVLSLAEQQQLIKDLEACSMPRTCPHGRPTMVHLSVESLEKQFGRRG